MPIVQNFPGPYELRVFYSTVPTSFVSLQHSARFNIQIQGTPAAGLPFASYNAFPFAGVPLALNVVTDNWVALLRPLLSQAAGNSVDYAELWKYTPGTFQASFMATYSIGMAGSNVGVATPAGQMIQTYRTYEGGIFKLSVMEPALTQGGVDTPPFAPAAVENVRGGIIGASNCFIGRDTAYPMAAIGSYVGQNEALFKRRYR